MNYVTDYGHIYRHKNFLIIPLHYLMTSKRSRTEIYMETKYNIICFYDKSKSIKKCEISEKFKIKPQKLYNILSKSQTV